jgi:hypothetical protein
MEVDGEDKKRKRDGDEVAVPENQEQEESSDKKVCPLFIFPLISQSVNDLLTI